MDKNEASVLRTLVICLCIVGGLTVFMYFLAQIVHDLTDKKWWEVAIPAVCGLVGTIAVALRLKKSWLDSYNLPSSPERS